MALSSLYVSISVVLLSVMLHFLKNLSVILLDNLLKFVILIWYSDNILSNKRNARIIKLNHKFILALKDSMNICVRYEYNRLFLSTTKYAITEQ